MVPRVPTLFFSLALLAGAQTLSLDLTTVPTGLTPQSLVVGDFNHDGKPDIAVSGSEGSVAILLGNGDGTFHTGQTIPVGAIATRILKADFDHDGNLDLAVQVGTNGQVVILLGKSDGVFQTPFDSGAKAPSNGPFIQGNYPTLVTADINGDGKLDLILGPYALGSSSIEAPTFSLISVSLGAGDGTFEPPVVSTVDPVAYTSVAPVDFYNDGKTELFLTALSTVTPPTGLIVGSADGKVSIAWFASHPLSSVNQLRILGVGDINGNGRPDVVVLDPCSLGGTGIYAFLDGGTAPVTSPLSSCNAANQYNRVALADLDGDGKADLLLSDAFGDLFVLPGKGDGTFRNGVGPGSAPFPASGAFFYTGASFSFATPFTDVYGSMTTADFQGTGKQDVIMALAGKSIVLLKNGAGAPPKIAPGGVVSAAAFTPVPGVAGSLISIFGTGFSYQTGSFQNPGFDRDSANWLFGATVTVNGFPAPLLWISPTQANAQVPWEVSGQTEATVSLTKNGMTALATIRLAPYSPALFTMSGAGTGQAAAEIAGSATIAATVGSFSPSRPAHPGEYVSFYGTGFGSVDQPNPVVTGQQPNTFDPFLYYVPYTFPTLQPVTATVGNIAASVQFAGLAPGTIGAYQINVLIPSNAPLGNAVPVTVSIGGIQSPPATIAIGQ